MKSLSVQTGYLWRKCWNNMSAQLLLSISKNSILIISMKPLMLFFQLRCTFQILKYPFWKKNAREFALPYISSSFWNKTLTQSNIVRILISLNIIWKKYFLKELKHFNNSFYINFQCLTASILIILYRFWFWAIWFNFIERSQHKYQLLKVLIVSFSQQKKIVTTNKTIKTFNLFKKPHFITEYIKYSQAKLIRF